MDVVGSPPAKGPCLLDVAGPGHQASGCTLRLEGFEAWTTNPCWEGRSARPDSQTRHVVDGDRGVCQRETESAESRPGRLPVDASAPQRAEQDETTLSSLRDPSRSPGLRSKRNAGDRVCVCVILHV